MVLVVLEHDARERQDSLDDHVVCGHEIDLGAEVRRVVDQPAPRLGFSSNKVDIEGDVVAHALQARVDVALVELEDLAVVAIEECGAPRRPAG